jgi:hypothetical protein
LSYLQSPGINRLRPDSNIKAIFRMPDDSEAEARAVVTGSGHVLVDTTGLDLAGRDLVLRLQLKARLAVAGDPLPVALASFDWTPARPRSAFAANPLPASVESSSPIYGSADPITVRWAGIPDPDKRDWVGVYPVGGGSAVRLAYIDINWKSDGDAKMGPLRAPGKYELRLFRENGWDLLAVSAPFDVVLR